MRIIGFLLWQASHRAERTKFRVVCKALVAESIEILGVGAHRGSVPLCLGVHISRGNPLILFRENTL